MPNETIYLADATKGVFRNCFDTLLTVKTNAQGKFTMSIDSKIPGFYHLYNSKGEQMNSFPLMLHENDTLIIDTDTASGLLFSGNAAHLNNFLSQEQRIFREAADSLIDVSEESESFEKDVKQLEEMRLNYFHSWFKDSLNAAFKTYILNTFSEQQFNTYFRFLELHSYYAHGDFFFLPQDSLNMDILGQIDLADSVNHFSDSRQLLLQNFVQYHYQDWKHRNKIASDSAVLETKFHIATEKLTGINREIALNLVMDEMKTAIAISAGRAYEKLEKIKSYYSAIAYNSVYSNAFNEAYRAYKLIAPGQQAPMFSLPDTSGKNVSLQSLQGKNVLIYYWGTWCPPCLASMPKMMALVEKYKGKDITFLFVALEYDEEDITRWKEYVRNKKLKGIHVVADKQFHNEQLKPYLLSSAPTYVLIDKKGHIVRPRFFPDYEKALLDSILIY